MRARIGRALQGGFTRGLRFRLTLTYLVFFAVLLVFLGLYFRQTLNSLYDSQLRHILNEEWGAVRGYLRIEKGTINWFYDSEVPEEAIIVDRLRQIYLLADRNGKVLQVSETYEDLGVESPEQIRAIVKDKSVAWLTKTNQDGAAYLIRAGVLSMTSEDDTPYFVAIGRSYEEGAELIQQFARHYSIMLPAMLILSGLLGWFMAGRALRPINDVARTAQRITGSNLRIQIAPRGADDELDRLIDAFNRMIERLDAAFQQTRQFSTDVSHELRTPLTAVRGQLEVALLAAKTPEQYQEAILTALEDVERLSQTIRVLLQLSHAESGQLTLRKQTIDMAALLSGLMEQFEIPAESGKVTLTTAVPAACYVEADRIQLERLVSNLVSNAVKYTPEGGSIHVSLRDHGKEIELRVQDTGVGIAPDHLPHIFDRFYRIPSSTSHEETTERGLGLGLSFVAWIVKEHRGHIDVQSTPGKGATFTVWLPKGEMRQHQPDLAPAEKV